MERSLTAKGNAQRPTDKSVQEILTILHKWGIHTLGQFAALDREQLGARLGPEAVRMWERANGQSNRVLKLIRPPESFEESFEFENEIETAEPLLFMLRRFLEQLAIQLSGIYLVAKELTLRITFTNKQIYERIFKIPQPTNNVDLLFRMLHTHLENFKSKYPIVAVALSAQPIKPAREQFGLFETTLRNPHQLSETLARLTGLLGADRCRHAGLGRNTSAGCISNGSVFVELDFHVGQVRASPVTPGVIRRPREIALLHYAQRYVDFDRLYLTSVLLDEDGPAHVRSADVRGKIIDLRGPLFDFRKLVGRKIMGARRMGSATGRWRTGSVSRIGGNLEN